MHRVTNMSTSNATIEVTTEEQRATFYGSKAWRQLRLEVLRDNHYECIECKRLGRVVTQTHSILEVHHVIHLEDSPDTALDKDNLIVLCKSHHNKIHKRFEYDVSVKSNKWVDDEIW